MAFLRYLAFFFTFRGRLNRARYFWMASMSGLLVAMTTAIASEPDAPAELAVGAVAAWLLCAPSALSASVRRLHDMGHSGAWVLLGFVPIANVVLGLLQLFSAGKPGLNQYGDDPLAPIPCPRCAVASEARRTPASWEIYLAFQTCGLSIIFLSLRDRIIHCRNCGHQWRPVDSILPGYPGGASVHPASSIPSGGGVLPSGPPSVVPAAPVAPVPPLPLRSTGEGGLGARLHPTPGASQTDAIQRRSKWAMPALICSFTGWASLLGVVFGVLAIRDVKRKNMRGRGMAIAAIIIGSVLPLGPIMALVELAKDDIHDAAAAGNRDRVEALLQNQGTRVDALDSMRRTPLSRAVWGGHVEVARLLLDRGADVNRMFEVRLLTGWEVSAGGDEKGTVAYVNMTPLHLAVARKDVTMAHLLVLRGANVHAPSSVVAGKKGFVAKQSDGSYREVLFSPRYANGLTPLDLAKSDFWGSKEILSVLVPRTD